MLATLFSGPSYGQVAGGTLSGTVNDPSGTGIPKAEVVITNAATGVERTVTTNSEGFYIAPNLIPGEYRVKLLAKGFNSVIKTGITITVGGRQTFDVTLQIGTISSKVEVSAEVPAVQVTSSEISATVLANTVRELPLNGRSWTDLAALQAGVDTIQTQPTFATGSDRGNRGFGQQLTISGARPQQNNYRLDGVSLNDYANGAPGSVLGGNLGVDAIQEFSVLTSNYSAEYGKTSGGVVNAITRSGTNSFHGSVYEFLRNSSLDARNFFEDPTFKKAGFRRNQFGGAIGGPIIQNKTFFFADYEGIRQAKGIPNVDNVPSPEARTGLLHFDPTGSPPSGCIPTSTTGQCMVTVDPEVQKYLPLYPVPASCGKDVCQFIFSGNQVVNEDFFTTRIDHKFRDSDSLFGTYLYDKTPYHSPDGFGNVGLFTQTSRQIVAVEEAHNFTPTLVNAIRFGFNHEIVNNDQSVTALNPAAGTSTLGAFSGRNAAVVNVNGLTSMPGGVGGLPYYYYGWNSYQVYDDAFLNRGAHTIKFGIAVERMQLKAIAQTDVNGIWIFGSLQDFLTSNPSKFQGGLIDSVTPRNFRQTVFGAYVQDDWRLKSHLTLNLGLRYEMSTVPTETAGKLVNLRNIMDAQPICGVAATGCAGTGSLFNNPTLKNFEPRIGFSWDPFHNGKMAVRGGIGLFDVLPLPYEFILLQTQAAPFFSYTSLTSGIKFFNGLPSPPPSNKLRSTFIDSNPERNYVSQWNLNIQYELTPNLAAMIAYVGSRGVHQPFRVDEADLIIPTLTSAGYLWPQVDSNGNLTQGPNAGQSPNPINTNYSTVRGMFYKGISYYNALELQMAKRLSHGFQVQGTYTWAKSIDTSSATLAGDAFGNSISSLNYFDLKLTRGLSDFNVGRTFVLNATWELPSQKSLTGAAKWATNGWQLGTILTLSDGVPFTPTWGTGADPANTLSSDDFAFPNRVSGPACTHLTNPGNPFDYVNTNCFTLPAAPNMKFWTDNCSTQPPSAQSPGQPVVTVAFPACFNLRGNAGRNSIIGPGIIGLDFSVFKNNYIRKISESFNIQFRMEVFNILNHPNFAVPGPGDGNTDIFDGTGASLNPLLGNGGTAGQLVRTTIPERQIQFALKFIF
jgi:hypothetical protein